ncbi:IS4 family transposase [Singulisphaera acidiphila]|uniref:Transposase family protein n=4 Tax=Singulisphaera acidiphila TaxID=466153 RepID=H1MWA6_SINAD|nr:IS4 family transposase [Singulisphaera acidiphila]AGA24728.1 transposase family protein [Singulisphaera acidiphila DSM 18658]AGA25219.1 transposase family protein [Singulisphaera acidiphila DSM 18658]AGA26730.1 transposase family protein [Singulisphaera acidiphila DSM 18658]AGA28072.1 transposase family protein [Singulisphaera acidiphila DSM 18658]AGA28474.1 transposase family protein [Singulisphaera acidiphila DSM 18658]
MNHDQESPAVVDLGEAVRMFHRLVPPDVLHAQKPPTLSTVFTPWVVVWLMIYQRLTCNATMATAVGELARLSADVLPDNKRAREKSFSANTGGFSRARDRLPVEMAQRAADEVSAALIAKSPPSVKGRNAFLVDGSTLSLAPTDALRKTYPPARNQHGESHWPILHLVAAHELSSGVTVRPEVGAMYGPAAIGEVPLSAGLMPRLPVGSVLIADRNFGVFAFAWLANQAGHDFVLRLTEKRFRSMVRQGKAQGKDQWELTWQPNRWERKSNPQWPADATLRVWLHEVRISEKLTLWLVSRLPDEGCELAAIYGQRQNIETDLRDLKRTLRLEEMRGRSTEMVAKELASATVAYNMANLIRRMAAARVEIAPRRLSFNRVWSLVKVLLLESLDTTDPAKIQERIDLVLRMSGQCKLANRPGRHYPREVIARRRKFPLRPRKRGLKSRK